MSSMKNPALNGVGKRLCESWIETFVEYTGNLESAPIWRRWSAIATIGAVLEQKVFVTTSSPLYPNLYVFLVGDAGLGKTRAIAAAGRLLREMPEVHIGATSSTMASMVDQINAAKRTIICMPEPAIEYNSLTIIADELSAFMDEYDKALIGGLTTFYDVEPYSQVRRTRDIKVSILRPQLSLLCGSTPSNLIRLVPEFAWEQGFATRVINVFSEEKPIVDTFNLPKIEAPKDLIHDLQIINALIGEFGWTQEYADAMNNWKTLGHPPKPTHPRLQGYCNRRFSHMIKLTMISAVDRGNKLLLTRDDFNRAMAWLLEVEGLMPSVFKSGSGSADSKAMDEIYHYACEQDKGKGVNEHKLVKFARERIPAHSVMRVIEIMEKSGQIQSLGTDDRTGLRLFKAVAH